MGVFFVQKARSWFDTHILRLACCFRYFYRVCHRVLSYTWDSSRFTMAAKYFRYLRWLRSATWKREPIDHQKLTTSWILMNSLWPNSTSLSEQNFISERDKSHSSEHHKRTARQHPTILEFFLFIWQSTKKSFAAVSSKIYSWREDFDLHHLRRRKNQSWRQHYQNFSFSSCYLRLLEWWACTQRIWSSLKTLTQNWQLKQISAYHLCWPFFWL